MGKKHVLKVRGLYNNIRQICDFVTEGAQMSGLDEGALFHIELAAATDTCWPTMVRSSVL